jgi:hypothetical protein
VTILPYSVFLLLLAIFLAGYLWGNMPLFILSMGASSAPLIYQLIKRMARGGLHLEVDTLLGRCPVLEMQGKKYSALAVKIESPSQKEPHERYEKEIRYDRLLRFSEALNSLGVPSAYITFSCMKKGVLEFVDPTAMNMSLVVAFPSGRDESELRGKSDALLRQMEGLCHLTLPDCHTKRLGDSETIQLLSKPLLPAMHGIIPCNLSGRAEAGACPAPSPAAMECPEPSYLFGSPSDPAARDNGPFLGWIFSGGNRIAPLNLSHDDMRRHTAIFGCTGAGKSTTAISLALRLATSGIPLIILDWHGEHTGIVERSGGKVFALGSRELGITINPLALLSNRDMATHIELASDTFAQTFQFTAPQSYMFREALKSGYNSKLNPSLSDVINELSLLPIRSSWDHETRMALMRRLKHFTEGSCGLAINGQDSLPRAELFRGMVSLDLSHLKDVTSRAILANLMLKVIYDHAVSRGEQASLKHALFIEEAQNVLPPRRNDAPQSIGERILAEVRKYGEGVVIISQFPSAVSFDVIKNTSVRIIHAVRAGDDAKVLGEATSLDLAQRAALGSLAQGEAVVNLPLRPANYFVRVVPDPLLDMPEFIGSIPEAAPRPPAL